MKKQTQEREENSSVVPPVGSGQEGAVEDCPGSFIISILGDLGMIVLHCLYFFTSLLNV